VKVCIMPCRWPLKAHEWPLSFESAINASGDKAVIEQRYQKGYDAYMFWGMRRTHGIAAMAEKRPAIIVERAYLGDRFKWHAVGLNGLNGYANFMTDDVPDDRWRDLWADQMQPWQDRPDGYALVIGQVKGDAALRGTCPYSWAQQASQQAKQRYSKVYFRPHPLCRMRRNLTGIQTIEGSLHEALSGAKVVITHSSNTAVDAIMAGIPAVSTDRGSMAWAVCSHSVAEPLYMGDRDDWGRRMAYTQWLPSEFGQAWAHIRRGIPGA